MTTEPFQILYDLLDIVGGLCGAVYAADIVGVDSVELEDVVVNFQQRLAHLLTSGKGGVAQHADFRIGAPFVAQTDGVVDNLGKMGVARGLAITGKGQHVGVLTVVVHLDELAL